MFFFAGRTHSRTRPRAVRRDAGDLARPGQHAVPGQVRLPDPTEGARTQQPPRISDDGRGHQVLQARGQVARLASDVGRCRQRE